MLLVPVKWQPHLKIWKSEYGFGYFKAMFPQIELLVLGLSKDGLKILVFAFTSSFIIAPVSPCAQLRSFRFWQRDHRWRPALWILQKTFSGLFQDHQSLLFSTSSFTHSNPVLCHQFVMSGDTKTAVKLVLIHLVLKTTHFDCTHTHIQTRARHVTWSS